MNIRSERVAEAVDDLEVVDTIALLQDEIARLEGELRMRDELAQAELATPPAPQESESLELRDRRIAELTSELAERDRTLAILWEQVTILEEAEVARRAEWDQLQRWVEELELRVDRGGGADSAASWEELEASRSEAAALRDQHERERQSWSAQRRSLDEEIIGLRKRLDEAAQQRGPDEARVALERENRRLRQECHRLAAAEALAASAEDFRKQLREAREEIEAARREVTALQNRLECQEREHQAELATVRTQVLRERAAGTDGLTLNERMRALREHLSELHDQEEEERRQRRLSARIARLWTRTTPQS